MRQRILLLITDLELGGTPTVVRELAVRLDKHPAAWVQVACLSKWGPVADQLRDRGITVQALNARNRTDITAIHRLAKLINRQKFTTVFSFLAHANAAAAAAKLLTTKKIRFLQSIQTTQPNPKWHWQVQRAAHRAAEKIIVPSPSVAQVAHEWSGIPESKIVVIPNAIDPKDFSDLRRKTNQNRRIGFIGRLDPIKRIGDLISALPNLDEKITLEIFGQGPELPSLQSLTDQLNLTPRVHFHGSVPGPRDALRNIDVLVLPSQAEGFGLVLIEAMAAGIPVIGTNVPGIRDVITANQTGLLVPPQSPRALAAAIENIFTNPTLRTTLTTNALATVKSRFTWQTIFPQYLDALQVEP